MKPTRTPKRLPPEGFFLFTAADLERVAAGELRVTWRLWKYAHVTAGRSYPAGHGGVVIDDVRRVRVADVTDIDAKQAGLPDARSLIDLARGHKRIRVSGDTILYRVELHYVPEPPARPQLPLAEISKRLARLDAVSPHGPWTLAALRLVEANPGIVSRVLAADMGLPAPDFKALVRKLKALGLTRSLMVGYELSELGQTYLDSIHE